MRDPDEEVMEAAEAEVQDEWEAQDLPSEADLEASVPKRFSVRDQGSADWLVRKLVEAEAHIRRVKEQADREMRRTQREREFFLMRFGRELEGWAKKELAKKKGRCKSLLLLSGTVGFRKVGPKLVVENDQTVLAWARSHCREAVVVIERLSKTALNEHVGKTGELPEGASMDPGGEKFYVK